MTKINQLANFFHNNQNNGGNMKESLFHYRAFVQAVYDGDTITVDIDLGLKTWIRGEKIRLNRINAPEMRGVEKVEGKVSRDYLRELILKKNIVIQTIQDKKGKYGRYLGEIWFEINGEQKNINDLLVAEGKAVYKEY